MTESRPRIALATFRLAADGIDLQVRVPVPAGPARASDLLPAARALSDQIVRETVRRVEESGGAISCRAGCAWCCRGLVAISEVEARRLRELVEAEPEPRRSARRARFAAVRDRLAEAGLLSRLLEPARWTPAEYASLVDACFALALACPFLEEESCSIYAERPITCREYLVTSPPGHCESLDSTEVRQVRLPVRVLNAVARWRTAPPEHLLESVVPLFLAVEWAESHPDAEPARPGPELLRELLGHLTGSGG